MSIKKFKLMIKTHNITDKKYLCITKKENWKEYTGSGTRWLRHLNKYGFDFSPEILYTSDNYPDFLEQCFYYSTFFDVALSEEFMNVIPEHGYESDDPLLRGKTNLELWWEYTSYEIKREMFDRRNKKLKENHFTTKENAQEILDKISESNIKHWENLDLEERKRRVDIWREGFNNFIEEKGEKYDNWKEKLRASTLNYHKTVDKKVVSERNSKARLNTSPESKARRKKKIQDNHKTGKYQHIWDQFSEDRKGSDNPASKNIMWKGKIYNKLKFEKEIGKIDSNDVLENIEKRDDCYFMFDTTKKEYEILVCPHCNKKSNGNKPSSFKRWHFDNCKEKSND